MENYVTAGTHCFPLSGSFAVPSPIWREQVGIKLAMSAVAGSPNAAAGSSSAAAGSHPAVALGGRSGYFARFRTLVNSIGSDLPVIHRMRMSAPEP